MAVETEGVLAGDQVGDGVQVDGVHVEMGIPESEDVREVRQRYDAGHVQHAHDGGSGGEPDRGGWTNWTNRTDWTIMRVSTDHPGVER